MNPIGQQAQRDPQPITTTGHEDSALVSAVLRKDRKATAEFVARYADDVYRYVRCRLAPRNEEVDDLVQDIFLAAWESLRQFRGNGSLRAWVMGIARHKVEDHYRGRLREPESIADEDQDFTAPASSADFPQLLETEQLRKNTWRVMTRLPEQYRLALIWRYWERASAREIALKTGKTEKAIERLLARARAEFRKRWKDAQFS